MSTLPPYVFVSYSRWDRKSNPLLDQLLRGLREAGVRLWLAPDSVPPGTDWQHAIVDAQANADAHLALFSKRIKRATGMRRELGHALELDLPIVLVQIEPIAAADWELLPAEAQDMPAIQLDGDVADTIRAIVSRLPADVKQAAPVEPQRRRSKGYVFISYAQADTDFVIKLRQFMRERGYGYWDYQDSERNYHTQLFLELEDVIRNATATLSVLSPDWKKSQWTVKEFLFSTEVQTPVFLLMARDMGPTLVTAGIPYLDFSDEAKGFAQLERALRLKGLIE